MNIVADTSGSIWKINVSTGDTVNIDDVLVVLESMKMEIPVESAAGGTVAELLVAEGDFVEEGQPLLRLSVNT